MRRRLLANCIPTITPCAMTSHYHILYHDRLTTSSCFASFPPFLAVFFASLQTAQDPNSAHQRERLGRFDCLPSFCTCGHPHPRSPLQLQDSEPHPRCGVCSVLLWSVVLIPAPLSAPIGQLRFLAPVPFPFLASRHNARARNSLPTRSAPEAIPL